VATALLAAALFPAEPAHAAYPGQNGKILFDVGTEWGGIGTMNPDGTGQQRLTSAGSGSFSADGNKIVFVRPGGRDLGYGNEIWVMNSDGSDQTPLTKHKGQLGAGKAEFSPDGSKIVFEYYGPGRAIRIINSDGTGEQVLADNGGQPTFAPDGNSIVYTETSSTTHGPALVSMGVDGSGKHQIPAAGFGLGQAPELSPDGTKLAYIGQVSETSFPLFLANADGSGPRQLPGGGPIFSPDGTQLAGGGSLINVDGSNLHQILAFPGGISDWQPVTPATRNGPLNLALCDGKPATISATPGRDLLPNLGGPDVIASLGGNDVIKTPFSKTDRSRTHDTVCGGPGNDKLVTVDRSRDVVDCGPGMDSAVVDAIDRVKHCERVKRVKVKVKKHHG
jgi:Tol biopolymer transport system component